MNIKEIELLKLAKKRQEKRYEGYGSISDYDDRIWECDYISPYSKSAHNVDSDVVVILQDWCSESSFNKNVCKKTLELGYTPDVQTNKKLINLLDKHLNLHLQEVYATNLFPYIKKGAMRAPIPMKDLVKAAIDFTIPALNIIKPKIAICLGLNTFNALRIACGSKPIYPMNNAIGSLFTHNNMSIFAQAHTGHQGVNIRNRGGVDRVNSDWESMANYLKQL